MNIVRIRLRKPRRVLLFSCGDMVLYRDEKVIVETDQGIEWGECVLPPEPCSPEMEQRVTMRVLRKATPTDLESFKTLGDEEEGAKKICMKHIQERQLPMHLVDVQYTFDRHKITFYFTADNRVDFRELVRDLARDLHSRIELRHIQVRDRSKLVGGLGTCGRELCCTSWLEAFVPISMRMAKCQNLSLNPTKISGQCGRLLCCLQYENEVYERGEIKPATIIPMADESIDEAQLAAIEDDGISAVSGKSLFVQAPTTLLEDIEKNSQEIKKNQYPAKKKKKNKKQKGKTNGKK